MMINIGSPDWASALRKRTARFDRHFWRDFTPAKADDIEKIEAATGRIIDPEFRQFYETVGYGSFPAGGDIFSPEEIIACIPNPIFFVTGSHFPNSPWMSMEDHVRLWKSRGIWNPIPEKLCHETLSLDGIFLYDLLQIGSNGACCYHQLYVGPEPAPLRYCLLTPEATLEARALSFSQALDSILSAYEGE